MESKISLNDYLEGISKKRKQVCASEDEIEGANDLINSCEELSELIFCLQNVQIHGSFKIKIMKKIEKTYPEYFNQ